MMKTALIGARIWSGSMWHDDAAVLIADGRIEGLVAAGAVPDDAQRHRLDGGLIAPGFVDVQVNGGGGVLFNDHPTVDGLAAIAAAHRRYGTTAMLATLISDDLDVIASAIAAVDAAIAAGIPGIAGIHIEGPFLNPGKRGIHDARKFRVLDEEALALLCSLRNGRTLVTLAPETAPPGAIRTLVDGGVVVAAGHTLADHAAMQDAIASGLSGVTHLFNAMTPLESRAPGVVGAALDSDLHCGIIVDGLHVDPAVLRIAYRAKGAGQLMLVTDAMPTVGSELAGFMLGDTAITIDGMALRSADGTLAGSNLDMATALRNCVAMMRVEPADALRMASLTPAQFMGLSQDRGMIAPGYRADLVHLDDALRVTATWIGGKPEIR